MIIEEEDQGTSGQGTSGGGSYTPITHSDSKKTKLAAWGVIAIVLAVVLFALFSN